MKHLSGTDYEFREPSLRREQTVRRERERVSVESLKAKRKSLNRQNQEKTLNSEKISGLFKVTSSIVIILNREFNCMCREKKHFLFHWNTLTLWGQRTQIWMCCKKNVLMIIGMLMKIQVCQIRGQDSRSSLCWKRHLQKNICGPRGDWQKFKRLLDQIMCGLKRGPGPGKLKEEKKKNGQSRNRNSTMPEYKDIIMNARRKLERHKAAAMPCKKRPSAASSWKTGASTLVKATASDKIPKIKFNCIVEGHESTRPRMESVTKKNHKDQFAEKGQHSVLHYNLVHTFIPMPHVMKIPDAKAAMDQEWKKLEKIPAWQLEKVESKKEVTKEARKLIKTPSTLLHSCTSVI